MHATNTARPDPAVGTPLVDARDLTRIWGKGLGAPGQANIVWSSSATPSIELPVAVEVETRDAVIAADAQGRDAIVVIFGAIGATAAGVAALAVMSSMLVSLFERRQPLGAVGTVLGLALGAIGPRAIIGSFESSNAVDIGVADATGAIPVVVASTLAALAGLASLVVRSAARRPIAVTLRGAA